MKLIGKYTPEMVYHKDRLLIRDRSGYGPMPADGPNPLLNAGYYDFDGFTGEFGYDWAGDDIIKYFKGYRGDPWSLEVFMHYSIIATNGHLFESGSYKLYIDTSDQLRFQNFYSPPTGFQDIILGDISSYDDQWIQIKILCDGVNLTAHIGSTELYSGTITAYSDGVQYPHFTIGDRNQAGAQSISHIKLTTNLYRFLWTFDYMGVDGANDQDKIAVDLSMNAIHLLPTHTPDASRYKRSGEAGNHPVAPGLLNYLGYSVVGSIYEPLKIDGSKSASTLSADTVKGNIPNTAQVISASCGLHETTLREVLYVNSDMSTWFSADFCMGIIFKKSDLESHSGHQLLLHKGGNWNTATHIIGARFNSNHTEITMYFKAPGLATLPDILHTSFADDDTLLFVMSRDSGVIRVTLEKIGEIDTRVTVELNIDNDLSGNTYPFVIGSYGDDAGEYLQNTKVMAPFISNSALTIDELNAMSLTRVFPTRLEVFMPINDGAGTLIANNGTLMGLGTLNNETGYWSTQDNVFISLLGQEPNLGDLRSMRFFGTESKIDFDIYGTYEMGLLKALQSADLSAYEFGDALVSPAEKTTMDYNGIEDYETNFIFGQVDDQVIPLTNDERHAMIALNGKQHYKD